MSVENTLVQLQALKCRVRSADGNFLIVTGTNSERCGYTGSLALTLGQVTNYAASGFEISGYTLTNHAVDCVIRESLGEIRSLKSKVKVLEQKLQAISDVLKGDVK